MNRSALDEVTQSIDPADGDEDVLYDVLDRALSQLEEGNSVDVDELVAGREHLRERAKEMVRLALRVGVGGGRRLPTVPGYSLMGELGQGGMGTVYLARQERLGGRLVALKVLPPASGLSQRARRRFTGEALAIGRLRHPNIVAIHDVIDDRDVLAYAMEWVEGQSLAQLIRDAAAAGKPLDIGLICRLGISIARGLAAVHRTGLVHRDVKPSNILIRSDSTPLLSDFGLVREADSTMTQQGQFAGTVGYSSPEQLRGEHIAVDERSDVYSLGITLFHALARRLPYEASEPGAMLREIERGPSTTLRRANSRVPRDLETIITKAMDADPARRYASADELADDLERLISFQPIRARRAGAVTRLARFVRRHRGAAAGLVAGSIVTLALAAAFVVYIFLAPGWAAHHVAEARLAVLHPRSGDEIFASEFFQFPKEGRTRIVPGFALPVAIRHYDAALRWKPFDAAIRRERDAVKSAGESADQRNAEQVGMDERSKGLRAYLNLQIDAALAAWSKYESQREMATAGDPLVDAAQGMLYLAREEFPKAYPRLRSAVQAFPDAGFLTVYLADAAVQCGDLEQAQQLLLRAQSMPRPDCMDGWVRVSADLFSAQGNDSQAEASYKQNAAGNALTAVHYARFLERRGRMAQAIEIYRSRAEGMPASRRLAKEFIAAVDRWLAAMPAAERERLTRAASPDSTAPPDPSSEILRAYQAARRNSPASDQIPHPK